MLETVIKSAVLLSMPLIASAIVCVIWYFVLFRHHIHFEDGVREIAIAAWIPIFGILYGLLAAIVLSTVWSEYKSMRMATKNYEIAIFMSLRDEDMSPLIHVMMAVLSSAVLLAFMGLDYPDRLSGFIFVGSTAYLFTLIVLVVMEIDNPCSGIWFIKDIPEEWLAINAKEWRREEYEAVRIARCEKMKKKSAPPSSDAGP